MRPDDAAIPALPSTLPRILRRRAPAGRISPAMVLGTLTLLALLIGLVSLGTGAMSLPLARVAAILSAGPGSTSIELARDSLIVFHIRMPRTLMGMLVGATLATAGALLQGMFRNPLADPALVGVSSGSALAAAATIVLGHHFAIGNSGIPFATLPFAAFLGGLSATLLLYAIATRRGRTSVATMLLAGIAISALASAGTGLLAFTSDDRQLRDLAFWTLGSVAGATWAKLLVVGPAILAVLVMAPLLSRALNALVLGEAEAFHLGIRVERTKRLLIVLVAVGVGSSVAVTGLISFVGLVVPHLVRIAVGPDHRLLLPASALGGAILLIVSDMLARIIAAPAELPIGIVTAVIGAPYFLWLLLRRNTVLDA